MTLSPKKVWLLAQASSLLLGLRLALRLLPGKTVQRCLQRTVTKPADARLFLTVKTPIIWSIEVTSPWLGATCLPRALAAQMLLAKAGYETQLRMGLAKSAAGKLEGHAWLERDGDIVIGNLPDLERFVVSTVLENAWRVVSK